MKTIFQIILFALFSANAVAQNSLLEKANEHYTKQEYQEAIDTYLEILNGDQESAEVHYNLGNAYYKTGQVTQAIISYERAKLLAPNDEDIQFNLDLANQHVVDAIDPLPQVFFVRWWHNIANKFSTDGWAKISVFSFVLFLLLAGIFFFTRTVAIKRLSFWFGILIVAISIFSFNFAARQKKRMTSHNFAIITQPSVTVKSSPSETGTDLFLIHEGLKVEIKDSLGSWREIRIADGNQGWLPENSIEKI
ncbi:tetratricopeptide repeat protein [uncultured Sunxiuqinia sp.]|uniref:tetratricopeptide repeat protein n=1 Tax=Sunxiuqinia rutila TaxID=1397841 RepID=UPI00262C837F|nr:tetratricopeptide repeat protein [uncultured Sunxiuqinia sp.]